MKRKGRKRGPKSLLEVDPTLQKRICDLLAKCNTIKTAAAYCGISEKSVFSWINSNPSFRKAIYRARSRAKTSLVAVIREAAPDDWRAAAWILERSWPNEYARIERVEQVGEKAESVGVNIYYDTGGKGLAALTDFPYDTDPPEVIAAKQAKLLGHRASDDDQAKPQISDAPPPKVVPKALTGRIRPEWKGNNHGQN